MFPLRDRRNVLDPVVYSDGEDETSSGESGSPESDGGDSSSELDTDTDGDRNDDGVTEMTLTSEQYSSVNRSLDAYRNWYCTLDYSPTGAGKTVMTIAIAKHLGLPVLVICPPNATENWRRESEKYSINLVDILSYSLFSASSSKIAVKVQEVLSKYFATEVCEGRTTLRPTGYLVRLVDQGILLVADEIHAAKTISTSISAYSKCLVSTIVYRCSDAESLCPSRVRLLSATPCDKPYMVKNVMSLMGLENKDPHLPDDMWSKIKDMFAVSSAPVGKGQKLQSNIELRCKYMPEVNDQINSGLLAAAVTIEMIRQLARVDPYAKFLFVSFNKRPLEAVANALPELGPVMINGSTQHRKRVTNVSAFQAPDTRCRLFVGQLTSIAESINLHDVEVDPANPERKFRRWMFLSVSDNYTKSVQAFGRTSRHGSRTVPINILLDVSGYTTKVLSRSLAKAGVVGDVASSTNVPTKYLNIVCKTPGDIDYDTLESLALEHFGLRDP